MKTKRDGFLQMGEGQCHYIRNIFKEYTARFMSDEPLYNKYMELKRYHTARVCENIIEIGRSLNMDQEELNFVEILAWLHDIGRFEQYHKYRTFDDSVSENHAVIGLRVIEQEKILDNFPTEHQEVLTRAILNHNLRSVPENEPEKIDFYSRIIRDADKLDIWRISIEMNITYKLQEEKLSDVYIVPQSFINSFRNKQTLLMEHASTLYDNTLFKLSWIFDLNFSRSFELFIERKIGQDLFKKIPHSNELESIRKMIGEYIETIQVPTNLSLKD
jgi:hypothetical protein